MRRWREVFWGVLALALLVLPACGRGSAGHEGSGGGAPASSSAQPVAAAPKPTGPLPAGASCVTPACHATLASAERIHGPVGAGACDACHQPDTGTHSYPLKRQGNATCTFCHAVAGTKSHQHKAIEQSGCTACHDPHTSKAKYLLTADNIEQLCRKCHEAPLKKHAHEPFAAGQCTVCHQPHQTDSAMLLRGGSGPDHCYSCHAEKRQAITKASVVHRPAAESCTTCHGPHATDYAKQLKASVNNTCFGCHAKAKEQMAKAKIVHGALTTGNGCANCHDPHASETKAVLKGRMDKVCLTCHDKSLKAADGRMLAAMGPVLASKNLHGPVKSGNCSDCHNPHWSDERDLLRKDFPDTFYAKFDVNNYALCFSCHDKQLVLQPKTANLTNFRDGTKNLHFVHVNRQDKGRTCKTCHEVHGSDLPRHMAAGVPFEGSNWSMPIRFEESPEGGSCTPGCHQTLRYNREKPTGDTASRDKSPGDKSAGDTSPGTAPQPP